MQCFLNIQEYAARRDVMLEEREQRVDIDESRVIQSKSFVVEEFWRQVQLSEQAQAKESSASDLMRFCMI